MVIGLLVLTAIPTTAGVAFGVSEQRKANQRKEDARRMAKFNIDVECDGETDDDRDVNGRRLVVRNDKVCLHIYPHDLHAWANLNTNTSISYTGLPRPPKPIRPFKTCLYSTRLLHRIPRTRRNQASRPRPRFTNLRLRESTLTKLDLRGRQYTRDEIRESLSERDAHCRAVGLDGGRKGANPGGKKWVCGG